MEHLNQAQFNAFKKTLRPDQALVPIGLMDDATGMGSPNTACQKSFETAAAANKVIEVVMPTNIPGVTTLKLFRIVP